MSKLDYFKGKVCTIFTSPTTRFFDESQHANVFVGLVDDVDEVGVWLFQLSAKKKSFFSHRYLVGIVEETVQMFTDSEAREIRKQLESILPPKDGKQLISVDDIKMLKKNHRSEK